MSIIKSFLSHFDMAIFSIIGQIHYDVMELCALTRASYVVLFGITKIIRKNIVIGCLALVIATQSIYGQVRYDVTPINLGPFNTFSPRAINESGLVVGDGFIGSDRFAGMYIDSGLVILNLPGTNSIAFDINDSGYVVGKYQQAPGSPDEGFVFRDGLFISLPTLGGNKNHAYSISNLGDVVGLSATAGQFNPDHAYLYRDGIMTDLGTLVGDEYISWATSVNDSDEIVGISSTGPNPGHHAFLFSNGAMIDLGTLGGVYSEAWAINNLGQIAGQSDLVSGVAGFLYENGNMISLGSFYPSGDSRCINDSGLIVGYTNIAGWQRATLYEYSTGTFTDLNQLIDSSLGWTLEMGRSINNGGIIVGSGKYNGQQRPFLLIPKKLTVIQPKLNDKWISGEKDTIKWNGGKKNQFLQIDYSIDSGSTFNVIDFIPNGDTGIYVWDIPQDILSKKCMIRIFDVVDPTIADTSDIFKIKGYVLTRDSSGQYEPYRKGEDQWGFENSEPDMFPQSWYQQFNYQGTDPFTSLLYSQWQGNFVFASAISAEHPDWVSWVNTFGVNECYVSTLLGIYHPAALNKWEADKSFWNGSCFGIAASNALAFSYKSQFQIKYNNIFPPFANPITVLSNDGVKTVVNELFTHQFGNPTFDNDNLNMGKTPNQTLNELKQMLLEDEGQPKSLTIYNNGGAGAHTILAYRVRQDPVQKKLYNIDVYDNSNPGSNNPITIDTTGNGNNGTWSTPDWLGWGGNQDICLEINANQYLNGATIPKGHRSVFILSDNVLEISHPTKSSIRIIDNQQNVTGYSGNFVFNEIPGSLVRSIKNGSETPPYGYSLPADNYSVIVDNFTSDTVKTFFFTSNKSFSYKRYDAEQNQTDRFFFDGAVSVVNPNQESKIISLLNIINETTQEKLFAFSSMKLSQNDSVKIENPDSNKIQLISYGIAKDYDIELNYVKENSIGRFGDFNVQLTDNTTHIVVPDWTDITNAELMILVDQGNDGTIDDTLSLINKLTGLGDDQGSLTPKEFRLEQNYPNPFNPTTKISWQSPVGSHQTLKVYDILGNEVAALVDEYKPAGSYEVEWNASDLPSGVYFYKLQAGSFVETKKMILLR